MPSEMKSSECKVDENVKTYVRLSAGSSLVRIKPCFSPNSNYLFVVADTAVKVFSTKTGECLHVLIKDNHRIVALFINPSNALQLITISNDGLVCFWDYEDAVLIREIDLETAVINAFPENSGDRLFAIIEGTESPLIVRFQMDFSTNKKISFQSICPVSRSEKAVAFNKEVTILANVKENVLYLTALASKCTKRHLIKDGISFTCVAWHPNEECVATGDSIGRIILWYRYFSKYELPTRMTLHWHSLPVVDISFTAAGSYLFSGGHECVLVKWKPGSDNKLVLPRLGMPICHVTCSPENSFVATSHVDNFILLINATLDVIQSFQGLAINHHWEETSPDPVPTGLIYAPHLDALVLNGRVGHLQFYSLAEEKQLYNLDITQQNYMSRERSRIVYQLEVIKAAFDPFGHWLATVEYRNDKETCPEIRLKFWEYKEADQRFCLSTTIEMPHFGAVNALLFRPMALPFSKDEYAPMAFTTADDKRLRIWALVNDRDSQDKERVWTCQGVGFYRDLPAKSASFSEDGSVLSVAFGHVLTLWLPEGNALRSSLCHPRISEDIRQVVFGRCECSHLVACTTEHSLTVWDTLSLSVLWFVQANVAFLTGDPLSTVMAAFNDVGDLFIFRPSSPNPVTVHSKANSGEVIAAAFFPRQSPSGELPWLEKSQLYFMNSEQNLYTIMTEEGAQLRDSKQGKVALQRNLPPTPFGLLMAESRKSGVEKIKQTFQEIHGSKCKKIIKMMLSTPCHVLPSPKELCSSYLSSLMKPLQSRTFDEEVTNEDDDKLATEITLQHSESESDDESGVVDKMDVSETTNRITIAPANSKVDLENIGSISPDLDEDCLKAVREEDYSWLFNSPLFGKSRI